MRRVLLLIMVLTLAFPVCACSEESDGFWGGIGAFFRGLEKPKTYTVRYFVEGEEYFPDYEFELEYIEIMWMCGLLDEPSYIAQTRALRGLDDEEKRASYMRGEEIMQYEPPQRAGYRGSWDIELPEIMDGRDYMVNAVYTKAFCLEFSAYDAILDVNVPYGSFYLLEGEEISADMIPEPPEGCVWEAVPDFMPPQDVTCVAVKAREAD